MSPPSVVRAQNGRPSRALAFEAVKTSMQSLRAVHDHVGSAHDSGLAEERQPVRARQLWPRSYE